MSGIGHIPCAIGLAGAEDAALLRPGLDGGGLGRRVSLVAGRPAGQVLHIVKEQVVL